MIKLFWLLLLVACAWRLVKGRWPFVAPLQRRRGQALAKARALLQVSPGADARTIREAHRRVLLSVHPDRGGTSEKVHEADAARDMLLAECLTESQEHR